METHSEVAGEDADLIREDVEYVRGFNMAGFSGIAAIS